MPIHAVFLAGTMSLVLGALLNDIVHIFSSYQIQWSKLFVLLIRGRPGICGLAAGSAASIVCFRADQGAAAAG